MLCRRVNNLKAVRASIANLKEGRLPVVFSHYCDAIFLVYLVQGNG